MASINVTIINNIPETSTNLLFLIQVARQLENTQITLNIRLNGYNDILQKSQSIVSALDKIDKERIAKIKLQGFGTAKAKSLNDMADTLDKLGKGGKVTIDTGEAEKNLDSLNKSTKNLGESFSSVFKNRVFTAAISAVTRSLREAVSEMKEVDTQLTNINKVYDISAEELQNLGDTAYATASKYGVSASEYLSSVYTYTKAGLGDVAPELAELATKTMLVGDTTQDMADQFLLSVGAAWDMKDNISGLSKVVDEADYINNNYATSLQKLTEGLPRTASIASMAGMSVEETMAALGTVQTVTQESGAKTGTALRALILNILGDTTTEVEEGVRITKEQVESMSDILWKYAGDTMEAAAATGKLVDPMKAIEALATAWESHDLKESDLFTISESIGGKLRTNQLVALLQNFDMYKEMLQGIGGAAGTADAEVSVMLDSWQAKMAILKNTWTEFVQNTLSSDMFKGFIDTITSVVENMGSLGNVAIIVASAFVAIKATSIVDFFQKMRTSISSSIGALFDFARSATTASVATDGLAFSINAAQGLLGILTIVLTAGIALWNQYKKVQQEALDNAVQEAETAKNEVEGVGTAYSNMRQTMQEYYGGKASKEELAVATQALASALGLEGDAANKSTEELMRMTDEELRAAKIKANAAVEKATGAMLGETPFYIKNEKEALEYYKKLLKEKDSLEKEMANPNRKIGNTKNGTLEQQLSSVEKKIKKVEGSFETYFDSLDRQSEIDAMINGTYELSAGMETEAEQAQALASQYDDVATSVANAKNSLQEFDDATKEEKGDTFSKYADVYKKVIADFNAGFTGSNAYKEGIKSLFGADNVAKYISEGGSWEKIGSILSNDFWSTAFKNGGKDHGADMAYKMFDSIAEATDVAGEKVIKFGDTVAASFKETSDGLSVTVDDFDLLADALISATGIEVDADFLGSWLESLGIFRGELELSSNEVLDFINKIGALNGQEIDISKIINAKATEGLDATEIWDYVNAVKTLANENPDLKLSVTDNGEIQGLIEKAVKAKGAVKDVGKEKANPEANLKDNVSPQVARINSRLDALDGKTVNTTVNTTTVEKKSASGSNGKPKDTHEKTSHASGTDNAKGGPTLVNEKGPEIIQHGSSAWIAGGGLPVVTDMPKGAMVFTADETKQIMARSGIQAFKGGTASGIKRYSGSTAGTAKSTSSKKSIGGKTTSSSTGKADKDLSDAQKKEIDRLEDIVALRKSELDLIEAQNGKVSDQISKQREIQVAIKAQIAYMEKIGASQKDINKLYSEWYEIESDIAKLKQGMLDDLSGSIKDEIDALEEERDAQTDAIKEQMNALDDETDAEDKLLELEKKRLAVQEAEAALAKANAERTVRYWNEATGQWEWRASARNIKSAQESLKNAQDALADYQKEQGKKAGKDALQAQIDEIEKNYKKAIDDWKDIQESLKEPAETVAEVLARISDNATNDMIPTLTELNQKLKQFGYSVSLTGATGRKYDSGGILNGLGGIKATTQDEMVLPPDITKKMLMPAASATFQQRMEELSFMYGKRNPFEVGLERPSIGKQYNGDIYQMGGITLSEQQAKSTSVYDLARMSKNLRSYNGM